MILAIIYLYIQYSRTSYSDFCFALLCLIYLTSHLSICVKRQASSLSIIICFVVSFFLFSSMLYVLYKYIRSSLCPVLPYPTYPLVGLTSM